MNTDEEKLNAIRQQAQVERTRRKTRERLAKQLEEEREASARREEAGWVTLVDIDIPFVRLVLILVKVSLASIPSLIIVYIVLALLSPILGPLFLLFG